MRTVASVLAVLVVSVLPMLGKTGEITLDISKDRAADALMPARLIHSIVDSLNQIRGNAGLESLRYDHSRSGTIQSGYLKSDQMGAILKARSPLRADLKAYLVDINHESFACVGSSMEEIMACLLSVREFREALCDSAYNVVVLSAVTDTKRHAFIVASLVRRLIDVEGIKIGADETGSVSLTLTGRARGVENMRLLYSKGAVEPETVRGTELGKVKITEPDGSFIATLSFPEYGPGVYTIVVEVLTEGAVQYVPADSFEIEVAGNY